MPHAKHRLGDLNSSEALLRDLFIDLKSRVNYWAAITKQTAQARMAYVGQHLTSVVTGFPGGRSGARGYDLILPNGQFAEIKTCMRIDQLGFCNNCSARVAGIEGTCPQCGSSDVTRPTDSKWLLSPRNENDLANMSAPAFYYLVLFAHLSPTDPRVRCRIFRVLSSRPVFLM